ncbi:hydroxymethylbilane synthase [Clostridiaceae bacterium UIB06]|uniref:Porphobilinogen deaminase n=1 Tax=Clostridium thailandense TaxID=2794346 RepID=A0A949TLU2_9CLOT|nr:hydroxymethylbilane synthase [Clostridium thailandense]MBV7275244.1 hydroxymethylbilane synthase [Clostridium thailandense]MCH5137755.1 hydroxymethylbilane synthase [Clostridiaceae bacterium UIB06]
MKLKIATRRSKLAQVQTESIMKILKEEYNVESEKLLIETIGDKRLDVALNKIGGKGLFVKEIEMALFEDEADAAVHSMKDVPFEVPEMFEIAAIPAREDVRDVFVAMNGIHFTELRKGARVGTSSNRRAAQVKLLRPDLEIVPIRGNVQTRIDKIERENLDGIILAAAGLKRLDMENIITDYFAVDGIIPAVGQGALGIEVKKNGINGDVFKKLDCEETRICVEAERSFMRTLNGDCHSTIGAYAELAGSLMNIIGIYQVGDKLVKKDISGNKENYKELGEQLAKKILNA